MPLKVHIAYTISNGPWGGGNQFLKSLKGWFLRNNTYSDRIKDADVIIFNSHQELLRVLWLKLFNPRKAFVHRLDNLMFIARQNGREIDKLISVINEKVADGSVFQSEWSRIKFYESGFKPPRFATVIHNAPDPVIFYPPETKDTVSMGNRVNLIAVSWSPNPRKGFLLYSFLDERLDFSKYSMTFIGNSPVTFKNIKMIPPVSSVELARILRNQDIFISASINEACPNSLIEALRCGLVPVVIDSGAHREIVRDQGVLFKDDTDIIPAIEYAAVNLEHYKKILSPQSLSETAAKYLEFCGFILANKNKRLGLFDLLTSTVKIIKGKIKYRFTLA